jgi:hypothetical protein
MNAPGRIRTCDLALRRRTLYPLSYRRGSSQSSRPSGRAGFAGPELKGTLVRARDPKKVERAERATLFGSPDGARSIP